MPDPPSVRDAVRTLSTQTPWADSRGRRNGWAEGGRDGGSTAFGSGVARQAEVAGAASGGAAGASAAVLGVHRGRFVERGRGDGGRGLAAGRVPVVSPGGGDGAVASVVVQAALGAVPVGRRTRGNRAVAGARLGSAGGRTSPGAGGPRELPGAAPPTR